MRRKIWDILYPTVFFYLAMIAASIAGMMIAGRITGIFDENASGLLKSVKGLPLFVSMGAFVLPSSCSAKHTGKTTNASEGTMGCRGRPC